ncbi:HipA domain-containing protein [Hydrogenophaga sp. NH-16]|uniref:type II toxin-antitoxin system HipA family toxin n=1 Tax=Hydrogenophaga sp. NH-16 TaxID=2184519 RepID=UPI000FD93199|nr:HipA domain-containing protein [Hydrogenophaga sp. NH-16]
MSATTTTPTAGGAIRPARPVPTLAYGPRRDEILGITMGQSEQPLGVLHHVKDGPTECSQFRFDRRWLDREHPFSPSPDLRCHPHGQWRTRPQGQGSPFFAALADTQPDGFAQAILERALGEATLTTHPLAGLESRTLTSLCATHDLCRLGALRIRPRNPALAVSGRRIDLPIGAELDTMARAIAAFERGEADERQIQLLLFSATSLGGSRPKVCFVQDAQKQNGGTLAVARLPSVFDRYPVAKAEMLLGQLAREAGIRVVDMALKNLCEGSVLITQRLDRDMDGGRKPYLSARSLLLAEEGEKPDWLDLLAVMRTCSKVFGADARQLWLRLVFMRLINARVSPGKFGFVYRSLARWELAPATALRPAMEPECQPAQSHIPGPGLRWDVDQLLRRSAAFGIPQNEARTLLQRMVEVVSRWKVKAEQYPVRMTNTDIASLEAAMENAQLPMARELVGGRRP